MGGAGFLNVAHAAVNLDTQCRRFGADFRAPALDHGNQEIGDGLRLFAHRGIGMAVGDVEPARGETGKRAGCFRQRPHGEQHAANVGMMDYGDRFCILAHDVAALHPFARERRGLLQRPLGDAKTLHADRQPGIVHRGEHVGQAFVLLADDEAEGAAIVAVRHHRGGARVDAHLVFERDAAQVIASLDLARLADQIFRHDEKGNAFHALRRVGQARQNQMNDVLGQFVVSIGDEDLLAADAVVIALPLRAGADGGKIGAGLRLGQIHRARPRARNEFGQELRFQCRRSMVADRLDDRLGQHRAERERHAGGLPHLLKRGGDQPRQTLAAVPRVERNRIPATFDEGAVGARPAFGCAYDAILQPGSLKVTDSVKRREHARGEFSAFLENGNEELVAQFLAAGQAGDLAETGEPRGGEAHVGDGSGVGGHVFRWADKPGGC